MATEFNGQSVLVTGAGSGIGASVARRMAQGGAKVLVADVNQHGAAAVAAEIQSAGGIAHPCHLQVTSPESVAEAVSTAERLFGRLSLAVNNAGINGPMTPTAEWSVEEWREVIDVNLSGVFYCLKYEIPAMLRGGGGTIVNMASIFSSVARTDMAGYVAAKHGVAGLTRAAALDYATKGIRVNAVGPGVIETPLLEKHSDAAAKAKLTALHPLGRFGQTTEIADLVAFLLSEKAAFTTGSLYVADGGWTAQ